MHQLPDRTGKTLALDRYLDDQAVARARAINQPPKWALSNLAYAIIAGVGLMLVLLGVIAGSLLTQPQGTADERLLQTVQTLTTELKEERAERRRIQQQAEADRQKAEREAKERSKSRSKMIWGGILTGILLLLFATQGMAWFCTGLVLMAATWGVVIGVIQL